MFGDQIISSERGLTYAQIVYIDNIFYALTLPTIKLSILFMYRRIFHLVKSFQYALYAVGAIVLGWMISVVLTQIFSCNPVDGSWNLTAMATAKCKTYYWMFLKIYTHANVLIPRHKYNEVLLRKRYFQPPHRCHYSLFTNSDDIATKHDRS